MKNIICEWSRDTESLLSDYKRKQKVSRALNERSDEIIHTEKIYIPYEKYKHRKKKMLKMEEKILKDSGEVAENGIKMWEREQGDLFVVKIIINILLLIVCTIHRASYEIERISRANRKQKNKKTKINRTEIIASDEGWDVNESGEVVCGFHFYDLAKRGRIERKIASRRLFNFSRRYLSECVWNFEWMEKAERWWEDINQAFVKTFDLIHTLDNVNNAQHTAPQYSTRARNEWKCFFILFSQML